MGILVKHRKKDDKYRLWTTIADGWLSNWLTKQGVIRFLQDKVRRHAEDECEEIVARFPDGYWDTNHKRINDERGKNRYKKLLEDRVNNF